MIPYGRQDITQVNSELVIALHRVQDIDSPEDWLRAEWMFKAMRSSGEIIA